MLEKIIKSNQLFNDVSVILAGAGPGNINYLTINVFYAIKEADVIIYDGLVGKKIIECARKECNLILASKSFQNKACTQEQIINWMIKFSKEKKKVLRLKGGDPSIFGRGAEEIEALQMNKIPFKIFSGITASQGAINILKNNFENFKGNFCFITGHKAINSPTPAMNFSSLSRFDGKIIIYMGLSQLSYIAKNLIKFGKQKEEMVQIVKDISLSTQKTLTTNLDQCVKSRNNFNLKPPVIIIIN